MSATILESYLSEFPGVYARAYTVPNARGNNRVHVELRRVRDGEKCFTAHGVALAATGPTFRLALRTLCRTLVTLPAPHVRGPDHGKYKAELGRRVFNFDRAMGA